MRKLSLSLVLAGAALFCSSVSAGWQAGLKAGYLDAAWDTNNYPVVTEQQLGPHAGATTAKPPWADNRTWVYTGQVYLDGSTYHFAENIDDRAMLIINGSKYIYDAVHNQPSTSGDINLDAGWYDIEIRFGNGTGSAGPNTSYNWDAFKGFGYNSNGVDSLDGNAYTYPEDDGNMTLFRYDDGFESIVNELASDISSSNAVLNGTLSTTNVDTYVTVYWGTTDGGTNAASWTNHADFPEPSLSGLCSTNVALTAADILTFYRFSLSNSVGVVWAESTASVLSGEISVQTYDSAAVENGGDVGIFRVSRPLTATNGAVTVYFSMGGSAVMGMDYESVGHKILIPEDSVSVDIIIAPIEDLDISEGEESVICTLQAGNYIIGTPADGTLTLQDSGAMDLWAHRARIVFSGYSGTETLTDFPALVLLSTNFSDFSYSDLLSGQYDDLRFTDDTMNTLLNYEIESWDAMGVSRLWVQVPVMTNNAVIWAHWGRAELTAPVYSTNGAAWNNGYVSVFHFTETSGTMLKDSVGNYNGIAEGGVDLAAAGLVGSGGRFDGVNDCLSLTGMAKIIYQNQFTISGWMNLNTLGSGNGNDGCLFSTSTTTDPALFWYNYTADSTGDKVYSFNVGSTAIATNRVNTGSGIAQAQTWKYVGGVLNNYSRQLYVDGIERVAGNGGQNRIGAATSGYIGKWIGSTGFNIAGVLDEVRISAKARSADWVMAEYLNMASNSVFQVYAVSTPSLIVEALPVRYGIPSPAYGSTNLVGGEVFACSAPSVFNISSSVRYRCSGYKLYTNLLDLVETGSINSCTYTNSGGTDRLVWQWTRQYYVSFVNSGPGTFSVEDGWYDEGSHVTCTALGVDGSLFVGWDDVADRIPMQQVQSSITVPASEPFTLTASFIPSLSNSGWYKRMAITFTGYDRTSTQTNFPMMVKFSDGSAGFYYNDMLNPNNAGDLRFMDESGSELCYEVEKWDVAGDSTVWVRLPALSVTNNRIYALWGNPAYTNPPVYTSNGITWDNGYRAVYHLAEASGAVKDSSPFANVMSVQGVVQQGTNGIAGPASSWPAYSNNWMQCAASDSLHGMGQLTLQSWIYDTENDTSPRGLISKRTASGSNMSYYFFKYNNRNLYFYVGSIGGEFSGTTTGADAWNFVAGTYDKNLSSGQMKAYVNGVYKGSKDNSTGDVPVYNSALHLGILNAGYQVNGVDCCWRGRLDEARVSSKARSADWLWTEYNNVKNHTSFQSYHPHANGTIILIH